MADKKFDVKQLREKAINSDDIQYSSVEVPEWDVELPIKTLSTKEMKEVMKYEDDRTRMMTLAVLHGCKTEDGEAVFQKEDVAKLEGEKSFVPIMNIATAIFELGGMGEESVKEAKNS